MKKIISATLALVLAACASQDTEEVIVPPPPTQAEIEQEIYTVDLVPGQNLREVLTVLSSRTNWTLVWKHPKNFNISVPAVVHGTYEEILHEVSQAYDSHPTPLEILLYPANNITVVKMGRPL